MSPFQAGRPRRDPFPYDYLVTVSGVVYGLMAARRPNLPTAESQKPGDQADVVPSDFGEDARNPVLGATATYRDLSRGYGLRVQMVRGYSARYQLAKGYSQDERYWYAIALDASCSNFYGTVKGPSITTVTPATADATTGVTRMFEIGGRLYLLNGRYCLYRADDTSSPVSKDFGAGKTATDACVFYTNAAGGASYAYVGMGDAELMYRFDGATATTTWTQHASLFARAFAVVGSEFWRASATNVLAKVDRDADPWTAANWSGPNSFFVGDKTAAITRMAVSSADVLAVFKADGVYSIDEAANSKQFYPFMRFAPASANGEALAAFEDDLYVTYREGTYRITPDFKLDQVGPEQLSGNDSPVAGYVTAMAADNFNLYAGLWNPDTSTAYLLKFGAYVPDQVGDLKRIDAWHGSISAAYAGKKITCLYRSTIGADAGHARMYLGFSNGDWGYFALPCKANPAACSSYRFTTGDADLYYPTFHGGFEGNFKGMRGVVVSIPNASSTAYAQYQYRSSQSGAYTALGTTFTTAGRQRVEMPSNISAVLWDQHVVLTSTVTTASPQLVAVSLQHRLHTELNQLRGMHVRCEDNLVNKLGVPLRYGADQIRAVLQAMADPEASPGSVTVVWPDEVSRQVAVADYAEAQVLDDAKTRERTVVSLQTVDVTLNNQYGTYARLATAPTYAVLSAGTYADAARY